MLCLEGGDAREGVFCEAAAAGLPVPDFPCTFSGWDFLSRIAYVFTGCGTSSIGIHAESS